MISFHFLFSIQFNSNWNSFIHFIIHFCQETNKHTKRQQTTDKHSSFIIHMTTYVWRLYANVQQSRETETYKRTYFNGNCVNLLSLYTCTSTISEILLLLLVQVKYLSIPTSKQTMQGNALQCLCWCWWRWRTVHCKYFCCSLQLCIAPTLFSFLIVQMAGVC